VPDRLAQRLPPEPRADQVGYGIGHDGNVVANDRGAARIAQVANYVGPSSGGLRVVVEQLGRAQLRAGRSRLLVLPAEHDSCTGLGRDRRVSVAGPPLPRSRGRYRVLVRRAPVIEALEAFGPDVVEVHDQTTLAWVGDWARANGVRAVLFCHERLDLVLGEAFGLPGRVLDRPFRRWSARLAGSFDTVVCASRFAAEPFAGLGSVDLHVVPFGVDLDTFHPAGGDAEGGTESGTESSTVGDRRAGSRADQAWGDPRDGVGRLIFTGRLFPEKAPDVALDVLARLHAAGRPVRLLMVGSGPMEAMLHRRAERERLPVRFLGHVGGRADLAALVASADVALSPGPRETFGLGVLEAMACGTPVVVSSCGASRELVVPAAGGSGGTVDELAEVAGRWLADPRGRAERGRAARARAERFPWSATVAALEAIAYGPGIPAAVGPSSRRRPNVQNR
jgi:alpha-1,6-mannosyltransferase